MDHLFVATQWGVCLRCRQPQSAHPVVMQVGTECPGDHSKATMVVGDEGTAWARCAVCQAMIEPKEAKGEAAGTLDHRGRIATARGLGALTDRQKQELIGHAGFLDFLGEGRDEPGRGR